MQEVFKAQLKASSPAKRSGAIAIPGLDSSGVSPYIAGLVPASQESLVRIQEDFSESSFEKIVSILAKAQMIYVVGSKRAFPVTSYMSLTLRQQGIRNVLVDNIGSTAFDPMGCLSKDDVLLGISFSPYNSITLDLATAAKDRGAEVVSITDS